MPVYPFGRSADYPEIIVELGLPDSTSGIGVWDSSKWDTAKWADANVWTDITAYMRNMSTSWVRSRELSRQPANTLSMTLSNRDGRFTPGNLSGPYVVGTTSQIRPRVPLRVQAKWSGTTYPIFVGAVTNWQDTLPGYGKDLVTTVIASDAGSDLALWALDGSTIGAAGDLPGSRIGAILSAAGWTRGAILDGGTATLQVDTTVGTIWQLLQNIAESDGGLVFVDRDGTVVYHDRTRRSTAARSTATQITFGPSNTKYDELIVSHDDTLVYNVVNVTGNGLATQSASDVSSIALYSTRTLQIDGWMQTTAQASALAAYWLAKFKDPEYRVEQVRVTPAYAPSTVWPLVLDAQINDRHSVAFNIPGGGTITRLVHVAGISHSITQDDGWRIGFAYSSATPY